MYFSKIDGAIRGPKFYYENQYAICGKYVRLGFNSSESELFRAILKSVSESFRINSEKRFQPRSMKIGSKLIRLKSRQLF